MKKSHLKRTIALLLSMSLLMAKATGSLAGTTNTEQGHPLPAEIGTGDAVQVQQPIGTPFTDVTEDEALAFERGLEKELAGVTGADTELSKNAKMLNKFQIKNCRCF